MFFFIYNIGYIFIVRILGKQSKLILSRSDFISNLKIHGPCGPNAQAGADLQAFLIFCFKPNLVSAHKLILLIYGDNNLLKSPWLFPETTRSPAVFKNIHRSAQNLARTPPELLGFRTRGPSPAILRVRPWIYPLIMYRSLVFVENPQKLCFSYS
jgi:hypothetical protein